MTEALSSHEPQAAPEWPLEPLTDLLNEAALYLIKASSRQSARCCPSTSWTATPSLSRTLSEGSPCPISRS